MPWLQDEGRGKNRETATNEAGSSQIADLGLDTLLVLERRDFGAVKPWIDSNLGRPVPGEGPGLNCPAQSGSNAPLWDDAIEATSRANLLPSKR